MNWGNWYIVTETIYHLTGANLLLEGARIVNLHHYMFGQKWLMHSCQSG